MKHLYKRYFESDFKPVTYHYFRNGKLQNQDEITINPTAKVALHRRNFKQLAKIHFLDESPADINRNIRRLDQLNTTGWYFIARDKFGNSDYTFDAQHKDFITSMHKAMGSKKFSPDMIDYVRVYQLFGAYHLYTITPDYAYGQTYGRGPFIALTDFNVLHDYNVICDLPEEAYEEDETLAKVSCQEYAAHFIDDIITSTRNDY